MKKYNRGHDRPIPAHIYLDMKEVTTRPQHKICAKGILTSAEKLRTREIDM